jgi:putative AlgH/UPF0301 family transcriptional regulator
VLHAQDLSRPIMLVATDSLDATPFGQTVLLATPVAQGGHIGFIINRPSGVKLKTLLPEQPSARAVAEPVYLGGPVHTDTLFALARAAPEVGRWVIPLLPGLIAVLDEDGIDQILDQATNEARYYIGIFIWPAEELRTQVEAGLWTVKRADAASVFRKQPNRLWSELRATVPRSGEPGSWL